jgi:putative transposase
VHRRGDDGDLRSRLREIALERRRFGYRRLGIMLAREGIVMNHKKLLRLYRKENLRVRRRRFRVLNVVGDVTRECLAAVPDTSISGRRVVRELTELIAQRGKPGMIVSDNVLCWEAAAGTGQQISLRRV